VPKQMVVVDYRICQPEKCDGGICLAVLACPKEVLTQEAPYEMPDPNPALCVGCGLCAQACPAKAIQMM
jgi:translation initiation factor RLI1